MRTRLALRLFLAALLAGLCGGCAAGDDKTVAKPRETKKEKQARLLSSEMRVKLNTLYAWPDSATIRECSVDTFPNKRSCVDSFNRWLRMTIAPSWLPPKSANPIFLKAQAGGYDVIRLRYSANGFDVQISQTADVFGIKLTPENGQRAGKSDNEKLDFANALCLRVFVETGTRWNPQMQGPRELSIEDLPHKIAAASFRKDTSQRMVDDETILIGRPQMSYEGGAKNDIQSGKTSETTWFDTPNAWLYWCRNVYWWNDGKSLGIYFPKLELSQFYGSGFGRGDKDWFMGVDAFKGPGPTPKP